LLQFITNLLNPSSASSRRADSRNQRKIKQPKLIQKSLIPKEGGDERPMNSSGNILDLDSLDSALPAVSPSTPHQQPSQPKDLLSGLDFFSTPQKEVVTKDVVLPADKGAGMQISGAFTRKDGQILLELTFANHTGSPMTGFALQFNKNSFGMTPAQPSIPVVMPGQSADCSLLLSSSPNLLNPTPPLSNFMQVAVKNNVGVYYFQIAMPLYVLFSESGKLEREEYLALWKNISQEHYSDVTQLAVADANVLQNKLQARNMFYIARRAVQGAEFLYFSSKVNDAVLLLELQLSGGSAKICVKTAREEMVPLFSQAVLLLLAK